MRVLHVGKYFPPEPGGIERFLDALTREQVRQGLQPAVLAHDRSRSGSESDAGRQVIRVRSRGQLMFAPIAPGWPQALSATIASHRPDLLHLHLPNPSAFVAMMMPAARRLPWILHWHADVPRDARHAGLRLAYPWYARLESALLRRAAAIIATSLTYLDASEPLAGHRDRCHVVPLALDAPPSAAEPGQTWPAEGLRVLAVGRLSYYKGFDRLIDAIAPVEGCSLLVAGSGEKSSALQAQVERKGLGGRVAFRSGLDDAQIEACLQACDVLCLPSIDRAEAFGLVLLEAMRAGKPVIASRLPGSGMTEVVVDGETGLQCAPGCVEELGRALVRLRDDEALRRRLGEAGRLRYHTHYRLDRVTESVTRIYRSALRTAGREDPAAG